MQENKISLEYYDEIISGSEKEIKNYYLYYTDICSLQQVTTISLTSITMNENKQKIG